MSIIKNNKAFTLVELLISLAILSYIVMGFAHTFIYNNRALNNSKMYTLAQKWAADTLEDYKSSYYAEVATGTWTSSSKTLVGNTRFTQEVLISTDSESPGLKEIEVTVSWTNMGTPLQTSLIGYIADY
ncbi:MAG: prepilin-type N-terminal cleavage/methylation domain-containing protein [Elusimicrobia bacterium]|nr:prepilin-type N-terminal cleavage/methylation domain-containing protein [Elusimicrobiota bacterium]